MHTLARMLQSHSGIKLGDVKPRAKASLLSQELPYLNPKDMHHDRIGWTRTNYHEHAKDRSKLKRRGRSLVTLSKWVDPRRKRSTSDDMNSIENEKPS